MVICQGCGQAFSAPEGYTRNKIQCPSCGVICPVPAEARSRAGAASEKSSSPKKARQREEKPPRVGEDEAAAWLSEPEPISLPQEPSLEARPMREERGDPTPAAHKQPDLRIPCRRCGRLVHRQRECPACDGVPDTGPVPAEASEEQRLGLAPHSLELDEPDPNDSDEDPSPYLLADKELPRCPKCQKEMALGAVLCAACGFNLRTRKKAGRTYEPIVRSWETDMPLAMRLVWLGVCQGIHLLLGLLATTNDWTDAKPFLVTWPLLTAVLCFVLGTYDRIDLTRDARGRVKVTIRWRFCFVPMKPREIEVRGFEGVTTGQWHDAGFLEWFVFLSLLVAGVIPGLVWWYHAIYKPSFHVALARDHGHAEEYVYRGRSPEQTSDIATALCNAAGLNNVS